MNIRWVNGQILDDLIYKCDLAHRQLSTQNPAVKAILFKLNLQIASRLRLIYPIRNIGNAGPLKVNLEDIDYFYALEDVNKFAVASRSDLARKYLLPNKGQAVHEINVYGNVTVFFHAPGYQSMAKMLGYGNFSVQYAKSCLEYSRQVLFTQVKTGL